MGACKTASTCSPDEAQGTHVFNILGYSKHRGMGSKHDCYIRSKSFTVGGLDWAIRFYPDGLETQDHISVYLELLSKRTKVRASCDLRLVDQCTGLSSSVHKTGPRLFSFDDSTRFAPQFSELKKRSEIEGEGSVYLRDDRLTIECMVTVMEKPHVADTKPFPKIDVPPSDMTADVGRLLEEKEGFDVTFIVGGETIEAHRFVLAMRSPVFNAELYGSMREARPGQCINIEDMQPAVFKVLLHFIYTDSLPSSNDTELVRLLLVAADRYAMDRLRLVCESILCEDLNRDTVATTLALADQHNCHQLKDACLQFIKLSAFKDLKAPCPSFIEDATEKRRKIS